MEKKIILENFWFRFIDFRIYQVCRSPLQNYRIIIETGGYILNLFV